jgi:hypothetical protein
VRAGCALACLLILAGCSYLVVISRIKADHCIEWSGATPAPVHCEDIMPRTPPPETK